MPTIELDSDLKIGNQPVKSAYKGTNLINLNVRNTLFASGEQGVWYDPSDLSTMYQDAAGTIPVTGMEQPVGKILDKSGRGNHATQATTASRPRLSARVNIINSTEDITSSWNSNRITRSKKPLGRSDCGTYRALRKHDNQESCLFEICWRSLCHGWIKSEFS